MNGSNENPRPWAIVLAGGEGKRLASYTRSITGETTPKQFCPLVGNLSLLEQTWARVSIVVPQDRIITALTRTQERFYEHLVGEIPSRNLIMPSRPGEFHPEPLTDPDVNLSIHPARATPRKAAAFRQDKSSSGYPLTLSRRG
ncbi:MAG: hypothetical protein JO121_08380 [Deltaproteobacteria bacterium]|nr:hypothetical protein [Deltaproteobacteria bacterium]